MAYEDKIKSREELKEIIDTEKQVGKTIVQCHGCFDILHPGHIRYLKFAKEQGNILVISVSADHVVNKGYDKPYVPQDLRAENLAALEFVDYVCIDAGTSAEEILSLFKPDIYIKGKEFEHDYTGRIGRERRLVESYDGRVMFSSGDVVYSSTYIIENHRDKIDIDDEKLELLCKRNNIYEERLFKILDDFKNRKILVIGDTIVDEYIYCDALGMAKEEAMLTVSPQKTDVFLGGAAIVAAHAKNLGGQVTFITVLGNDERGNYVKRELNVRGIKAEIFIEPGRPTSLKQRYIAREKKLFKVNHLKDHEIDNQMEQEIFELISNSMNDFDGIIISDFCCGLITPFLIESLSKFGKEPKDEVVGERSEHNMKVVADVSGERLLPNVTKFRGITLTTPTEKEARLALCNTQSGITQIAEKLLRITGNDYIAITVGEKGMIVYDKVGIDGQPFEWRDERPHKGRLVAEYFPPFTKYVVDEMGAGDAALAGFALSLSAAASIMESAYIASSISAVAVNRMGNVPVQASDVKEFIRFKMGKPPFIWLKDERPSFEGEYPLFGRILSHEKIASPSL